MKKTINEELVNKVLYLIETGVFKVPYGEVADLCDELMSLKESSEEELEHEVKILTEQLQSEVEYSERLAKGRGNG